MQPASAASTGHRTPDISVVMPVFNSMRFLPAVVPPLLREGRARGGVEFIFVDNGSTDGSADFLRALEGDDVRVVSRPGVTISALRNAGTEMAAGQYISFIDSDCEIEDGYFDAAVGALERSGAAATGCEYDLPRSTRWIERAWHDLHYRGHARNVEYLNGGNLFVRREAFGRAGGFREDLTTGEDAELGQRINARGDRIYADPAVRAMHLGNPKSLQHFYRRHVWHGLGMWGTANRRSIDKPIAMMFAHLALTLAGLGIALGLAGGGALARVGGVLASQLVIPALTVVYRLRSAGMRALRSAPQNVFLYWLYYWARLQALAIILTGGTRRYRK